MASKTVTPFMMTLSVPTVRSLPSQLSDMQRARQRAHIRSQAHEKWVQLRHTGHACKVNQFIAIIAVSHTPQPSLLSEAVKPIIDAGTDAHLWADDDATHRRATVYVTDPRDTRDVNISTFIHPVSRHFQFSEDIALLARSLTGKDGYAITFTIPHALWVTSNMTNDDIYARQHGKHASTGKSFGHGLHTGTREKVLDHVTSVSTRVWEQSSVHIRTRFMVIAMVAYPHGVGYEQADPDNSAETILALLNAGVVTSRIPPVDTVNMCALAYCRDPQPCASGTHKVTLLLMELPLPFQPIAIMQAISQFSYQGA